MRNKQHDEQFLLYVFSYGIAKAMYGAAIDALGLE